jgi:hypothetical protein
MAAIFENKMQSLEDQNNEIIKEIKALKTTSVSKTYSSALKTTAQTSPVVPPPKTFAVIVNPIDVNKNHSCKSNEKTIKEMVNNINKTAKNRIHINNCKYVGKGGLVLNCVSAKDSDHLIDSMKQNNEFTAKVPTKRFPGIVVKNVDESIDEEGVVDEIVAKNVELNDYFVNNKKEKISENIICKFKFRRRQNETTNTWVLEISPNVWNILRNRRSIYMGWNACRFEEYLYIKRCYHCQRFGHISNECKDKELAEICGNCSGSHSTKGCTKTSVKKCTNCLRFNIQNPNKRQLSTNHSVFSTDCECLKRLKEKIIQNINYG